MNRGELSQTYRDAAGELDPAMIAARERETKQERDDIELSRLDGPGAETRGRIARGDEANRKVAEDRYENEKKDKKEELDRMLLLQAIDDRIAAFEADLESLYGENFTENLLADLHEEGLIDPDEYARIMAIEDEDERRRAIAAAIQDGIESGHIKPSDLEGHPWAEEWLGMHRQARELQADQVARHEAGELSAKAMRNSSKYEADHGDEGSVGTNDVNDEDLSNRGATEVDRSGSSTLSSFGLNGN